MRIGQKVALGGMIVSGGLAVVKIVTGLMAGSTSVVADGLESAGDVLASGLVFLGLTLAAIPADRNHPYGHGRAETLTGLLVGLMLLGAGVAISVHALLRAGDVASAACCLCHLAADRFDRHQERSVRREIPLWEKDRQQRFGRRRLE